MGGVWVGGGVGCGCVGGVWVGGGVGVGGCVGGVWVGGGVGCGWVCGWVCGWGVGGGVGLALCQVPLEYWSGSFPMTGSYPTGHQSKSPTNYKSQGSTSPSHKSQPTKSCRWETFTFLLVAV